MEKLSTLEQICFSTTRIETTDEKGNNYSGTGFFFNLQVDKEKIAPLLITNKHVVKNMKKGLFRFTKAGTDGNPIYKEHFTISYEDDFEKMWTFHPDDNVDLCALPIIVLTEAAKKLNNPLFYKAFNNSLIPDYDTIQSFDAVEDVIMVGYPNGIWDSANNMPIVRKGITATQIRLDYNNTKAFLIDAAVFPGSSGSPVLLYNKGTFTDKNGNVNIGKTRIYLLGIVNSVFLSNVDGDIRIASIPTQQKLVANSRIPNSIGNVIKAEVILDFIPLFSK